MNKSKFSYAVDFNNEIVGTLSAKEYFSIVKKAYTDLVFLKKHVWPLVMHFLNAFSKCLVPFKRVQNTRQFLQNLPANDVLLTGSRGTGKSSIVRALLTEYKDQGLRLIEIERDDLSDLPEIQKLIQKRPEKFIVYCDDLAFNAEDENYRSLKSVLDGSLQSGSSNFIIYATSNRRHLLPEFMHENTPVTRVDVPQYTELHPQEAIEEKISLSDRFGMWLSFYPMDQNLYLTIVEHYLAKTDMPMNDEAHAEALRWCQARGQRSGRAAYQFSKHWIGSQQLKAL